MVENNLEAEQPDNVRGGSHGSPAFERHFSVKQVAELWGLSPDAVRRIFHGQPGVVEIQRNRSVHKRRYVSVRIPQSVVERVHRDLCLVKVLNT
jgi:hypothetical protein